jgi:histidyl-tRNA synthetase
VLDCKTPACQPIIEKAPSILDSLSAEAGVHWDSVRRGLDALGIDYVVDHRLVRGLDYYVRTTFEVLTTELGAQNAVAGGGRYDGLIQRLEGPPDPGIGFAIGMERVVLLLGEQDRPSAPSALLIPLGEAALHRLMPVARALRARGVNVELAYGERKLQRELEHANRLGVRYAVIVGDTELENDQCVLRDMKTREQRPVGLDRLLPELVPGRASGEGGGSTA